MLIGNLHINILITNLHINILITNLHIKTRKQNKHINGTNKSTVNTQMLPSQTLKNSITAC